MSDDTRPRISPGALETVDAWRAMGPDEQARFAEVLPDLARGLRRLAGEQDALEHPDKLL